ncbi:creatininase family protein [Pseudoroseicyclus tamaricis]|uniref:creatininase family protein n=1 Tax=Pseudoroseicyclus tamaricis TaxID=2705421 RepID=UPI002E2C166D|nr:creatininase family protein [Pseudoroseicyclus tamaricis]
MKSRIEEALALVGPERFGGASPRDLSGGMAMRVSIARARELRVQAGMFWVRLGWEAFGTPEWLYSEQERSFGIHGGDAETSLVPYFRAETVGMGAAVDFRSTAETSAISPTGAAQPLESFAPLRPPF